MDVVYFSNLSLNTHRFVEKLGVEAQRIPVQKKDEDLTVSAPFVLITPTYGGGREGGAVPKQVIRFLNDPANRELLRGVISTGNTNFGAGYCLAGKIIAAKCEVPVLYELELLGLPEDVAVVQNLLITES